MIVWLRIVAPKSKRGSFKVRLPLLVGRGEDAKFRIQHHQVSRRHCEIFAGDGPAVFMRDLGSTNGTFLDGEQIPTSSRTAVRSGGLVRVGKVAFVVEYDQPGMPRGQDRTDETQPGFSVTPGDGADDESFAVRPPEEEAAAAAPGDGWDAIGGLAAEGDQGLVFAEGAAAAGPGTAVPAAEPDGTGDQNPFAGFEAAAIGGAGDEPEGDEPVGEPLPGGPPAEPLPEAEAVREPDAVDQTAGEPATGKTPAAEADEAAGLPEGVAAGNPPAAADNPFAGFDPLASAAPAEGVQGEEAGEETADEKASAAEEPADAKLLDFLKGLP